MISSDEDELMRGVSSKSIKKRVEEEEHVGAETAKTAKKNASDEDPMDISGKYTILNLALPFPCLLLWKMTVIAYVPHCMHAGGSELESQSQAKSGPPASPSESLSDPDYQVDEEEDTSRESK